MNLKSLNQLTTNFNKSEIDLSNVYEVYHGGFGFDGTEISSFITSSTVKELTTDLITFETLLKSKDWPVSKILQREVNRSRVEEISKQFLKGADKVKYFPPIVVALIPRDGEAMAQNYNTKIKEEYLEAGLSKILSNSNFSEAEKDLKDTIKSSIRLSRADGLFVLKPFPALNFQLFSWDKKKFFAIVIDGQHRFESLKLAATDTSSNFNNWKQDVLFIDGSEIALAHDQDKDYEPVNFFRKIFIDINKHPVQVSKAKQIIMDDYDVASLFVQAILDDDQGDTSKYLKPEIVDWHTSGSKHELPYVTSVINLHSMFQIHLLGNKSISSMSDLTNEGKIKAWIGRLNDYFFVDETIKDEKLKLESLNETFDKYKEIWKDDEFELFQYDRKVLDVARLNFSKIYLESFAKFFNKFLPYSELINFLNSKGVFDRSNDFNDVVIKSSENRNSEESILFNKLKRNSEDQFQGDYFVLLTVVGQKALFSLYYDYLSNKRGGQVTNERHLQLTEDFLSKINSMLININKTESKLFGKNEENEDYLEFYRTNYSGLVKKYPGLSKTFWSEVLYYGGNIKYNSIGVSSIKKVLDYCIACNSITTVEEIDRMEPLSLGHSKQRFKTTLRSDYDLEENQAEKVAEQFIEVKQEYIRYTFKKILEEKETD